MEPILFLLGASFGVMAAYLIVNKIKSLIKH